MPAAFDRVRDGGVAGEPLQVERDNDKNPVVSLREIANGADLDDLRALLIRGLQKHVEVDEPEEDNMALLMAGVFHAAAPEQTRALWVTRTTLTSADSIKQMVTAAQAGGFNTLLVQVRGRGDA